MQAGSTTASHQASQFAIFISYFSAVAAVVAYAHLAMLGSQPKTDFFCDNERHRPQHDWKQRTTLKEKKKERNQLATCNKSRVSLLSSSSFGAMSVTEKFLAWKLQKSKATQALTRIYGKNRGKKAAATTTTTANGGFYCQWQDNSKQQQQWPWVGIAAAFLLSFLTWLSLVSLKSRQLSPTASVAATTGATYLL